MNLLELQADPAAFRSALQIDVDGELRPLSDCLDPWQADDFTALDPGWKRVVHQSEATKQRAWLERPRGHSKSQDLAIMAAWALFASRRPIAGYAGAGDLDQARLLRDAIGRMLHANPWLAEIIHVANYRVNNPHTGSFLEIISSDAPTSYGLLPDFVICDEVTHWKKRDLWDSLFSSAAKRSTCILVCISNAGLQDDWQWELREAVRKDSGWHFSRLEGPVASWINSELLAEQERLLPPIAFRRLWLNEWTTGGGDALSPEVIDAAFRPELSAQDAAHDGFTYVAGLDLGVSRDASALVILGIRRNYQGHGTIRLANVKVWRPTKHSRVNLQDVEDEIVRLHLRFNLRSIGFDPWQSLHMASRLQSGGLGTLTTPKSSLSARVPMREITASGGNLQRMASELIQSFNDRRVELYPHEDLKRELKKLRIEEKSYGYRLVSPRDEHGHGDIASAFSMALIMASEIAAKPVVNAGAVALDHRRAPERTPPLGSADYSGRKVLREILYRASGGARGRFPFFG